MADYYIIAAMYYDNNDGSERYYYFTNNDNVCCPWSISINNAYEFMSEEKASNYLKNKKEGSYSVAQYLNDTLLIKVEQFCIIKKQIAYNLTHIINMPN